MLKLTDVNMTFEDGGRFEVLKNISLQAPKGEFICVIGPTGCGKTILLFLIAGFLKPTSGQILIEDIPVGKPNIDRAFVFQNYVLFPWKTVYGNVIFGLHSLKLKKEQKNELVIKCLHLVDLVKFKDWHVHKLSGGMQQRVAIARALVVNPKILLMDEPFSALDSQNRLLMRQKLIEIWQKTKKTIIFVTHSVPEAIYLADKIYLLTARPATVKKVIDVKLPRPRDRRSKNFAQLAKEIENHLYEEVNKTVLEQTTKIFLDNLLEVKL